MTEQLQSLAHVLTSFSKALNQTWPKVAIPDFLLHAGDAKQLTLTEWIVFAPVVNISAKPDWEEYAWNHQTWIEESLATVEETEELDPGLISPHIYSWSKDVVDNVARTVSAIGYSGLSYGKGANVRMVPVKKADDQPAVMPTRPASRPFTRRLVR